MKNQSKTPKQSIYRSEMYQTIDLLARQLNLYRQDEKKRSNLYRFHQEFDAIGELLTDLRLKIDQLMEVN